MLNCKKALLGFSLLWVFQVQAQDGFDFFTRIQLPEPGKLCFPQTMLYAEHNRYDQVMRDHFLLVSEQDWFRDGLVYVGFRLKSNPDELWFFTGREWVNKNSDPDFPVPFNSNSSARTRFTPITTIKLQPVIQTFISNFPVDVSAFVDDGELWVGYGLVWLKVLTK